jgi:hypothetical protein
MMNKQEFLTSAGLEMQTLDLWLEQRWLIPDQTFGGMNFSDVDPGSENWFQYQRRGHRRHPSSHGPAPRLASRARPITQGSLGISRRGFNRAREVAMIAFETTTSPITLSASPV